MLLQVVGMDTWHHEKNPEGITVEMHGNIRCGGAAASAAAVAAGNSRWQQQQQVRTAAASATAGRGAIDRHCC